MVRACTSCHTAKVKCVRANETDEICLRCQRLGLECVPWISRQGQGPRRSRKKHKVVNDGSSSTTQNDNVNHNNYIGNSQASMATTGAPSPIDTLAVAAAAVSGGARSTSIGSTSTRGSERHGVTTHGTNVMVGQQQQQQQHQQQTSDGMTDTKQAAGRSCSNLGPRMESAGSAAAASAASEEGIAASMQKLEVEDEIVSKGINDLGYNHYGLHHLIRMWTCLSYTRRSFSLLARASFLASRCGITMDEVLSNQSPFAKETNQPPLTYLQETILLPKNEQNSLGPPLDLREVPWDLLSSVNIDPRLDETTRNRWFSLRMTQLGKIRLYSSPNFGRDMATVEEMECTWLENRQEMIDLFLPKQAKLPFARELLNHIYLYKEPRKKGCYVTRVPTQVMIKGQPEPIAVDCIQSMKIVDLDTSINYIEFFVRPAMQRNSISDQDPNVAAINDENSSKRQRNSIVSAIGDDSDDPLMSEDFDFTELPLTDELEEWMDILGMEESQKSKRGSSALNVL